MPENGGRNLNGRTRWKLDSNLDIEQNEVTACLWVKVTKCMYVAKAIGNVARVCMLKGRNLGSEIECGSWENAVRKIHLKVGEALNKCVYVIGEVAIQLRGIECDSTYQCISNSWLCGGRTHCSQNPPGA
jgi:hypothetical protein